MVTLFSRGLLDVQKQIDDHGWLKDGYPPTLQRSFDLAAARNALDPKLRWPTDFGALSRLAQHSVYEWGIDVSWDPEGEYAAMPLLDGGEITPACIELAMPGKDPEAELTENAGYKLLRGICLDRRDGPAVYAAFRRTVIEHPVLSNLTSTIFADPALAGVERLRHLCARFGSVSAWIDATVRHSRMPEVIRCYEIRDKRSVLRNAAPENVKVLLDACLATKVPWTERKLTVAAPGDATVIADRGRRKLSYSIPAVPVERTSTARHTLTPRRTNPPIRISLDTLMKITRQVDERERQPDWPSDSLPPLDLAGRLERLTPKGLSAFFDGKIFTVNGATHVVGMLSSGKSTLMLALLFGLTIGGSGKRIAILVTDTIQGAMLSARLRRHGIKATVLSSLRNRAKHLHGIHWQRSLDASGWSLSSLGDVSGGFSTACPLDGAQKDLEVVEGEPSDGWPYPDFSEKQCHRLYQKTPPDDLGDDNPDDVDETVRAQSCPLWACCPAQEQQRAAAEAQVLIMTPQAFVHL
jgi:hypothetical protein